MNPGKNFISIGAGNVATHLVKALCEKGYCLLQVYSRSVDSARNLAMIYNAEFTNSATEIFPDADFYIVSLPDQVLATFLENLEIHDHLVFHTAGSHGLEVFGKEFKSFGIMYPLQTFSKNSELKISEVPILIEACNRESLAEIEKIARMLSEKVYFTDSETRRWIHLAAVFACNFTNHMLAVSDQILNEKNLDPEILKPLIAETFRKSILMNPSQAQTGPALRGDVTTLEKHIKMLENKALLQKIYTFTSESIQVTNSTKHNKKDK